MGINTDQYLYLDLLKKCLTRTIFPEPGTNLEERVEGKDWPQQAETMIGIKRMENIQYCIEEILRDEIAGDLIEAGVWRGGACIFMRGVLKVYGDTVRHVIVADSFKGFPDPTNEIDKIAPYLYSEDLKVSLEKVEENFSRYGLLDDQVDFVEGYFKNTLPTIERTLSLLRVDCDLLEPTTDVLETLYPKLSIGGFVVIDDYGTSYVNTEGIMVISVSQVATDNFRLRYHITEKIERIDHVGVYWRKERQVSFQHPSPNPFPPNLICTVG